MNAVDAAAVQSSMCAAWTRFARRDDLWLCRWTTTRLSCDRDDGHQTRMLAAVSSTSRPLTIAALSAAFVGAAAFAIRFVRAAGTCSRCSCAWRQAAPHAPRPRTHHQSNHLRGRATCGERSCCLNTLRPLSRFEPGAQVLEHLT